MAFRLRLDDRLFPVQAFFNAIWDVRFVKTVQSILQRQNRVINECGVFFSEDIEEEDDEGPYSGVKFFVNEFEVIVSDHEFVVYVKMACDAYVQKHPEDTGRIVEILELAMRNFPV